MKKCSVEVAVELIDGKWKIMIIHYLLGGKRRFNELKKLLPGVTQRMLTNQLRELERDLLVSRTVHAEVPPRVEYELTELGRSMEPILLQIRDWGERYEKALEAASQAPVGRTAEE